MFTLNVDVSPFVNVKFLVPVLNDAVIKLKLVEVNKDAVAVFMLLIDILTDALLVSKLLTLWLLEEVYALNDAVVAKLPVSIAAATTLTLNVVPLPFVKVIVLPAADAVTNELAVIADVA
jgi:hypothetical protein